MLIVNQQIEMYVTFILNAQQQQEAVVRVMQEFALTDRIIIG